VSDDVESLTLRLKTLIEDRKQLEDLIKQTEERAAAVEREGKKALEVIGDALRGIRKAVGDQADPDPDLEPDPYLQPQGRRGRSSDDGGEEEDSSGPDTPPDGSDPGDNADET
jgi:hypothetical protein